MQTLQTFPNREALYEGVAGRIAEALRDGIAARGHACAALSGGTTPEPAYALLTSRLLDWSKVTLALVDERFVAPDHPASNEAMLRRALRKPLEQGAQLAPMYALASLEEAAARADALYAQLSFDIAVMGMGADGHTASWFPAAEGLAEALDPTSARNVVALRAPQAAGNADRLSLTLSAVKRAKQVILVITGMDKFATISAAMQAGADAPPVAALLRERCPEILWAV